MLIALFFNPGFPSYQGKGKSGKWAKDPCIDVRALPRLG